MKKLVVLLAFALPLFLTGNVVVAQTTSAKPFVLGIIEEIQSRELSEKRILNIYLPAGYNPADTVT
ncbi:MAG: hypothetical protein JNN28_03150, partial [Saprospiraceae bacterium]|nr:hypothetical protein [Saprospiraceae bacterium]